MIMQWLLYGLDPALSVFARLSEALNLVTDGTRQWKRRRANEIPITNSKIDMAEVCVTG